ncbi:6920_t:CDS:2 [Rhizophagus irregularis]|nr:6920_t:CDS:2 [Rhizophagus irregularis]
MRSELGIIGSDRGEQEMEAFLENGAQLSGNKNMYVVEYLPSAYSALAFGTTTIFLDNNKTFFD